MKKVVDNNGIEIEVSEDIPVNTTNGIHYLLTQSELTELAEKKMAWESKAEERHLEAVTKIRESLYGSAEKQIEFIVENGLDALIARNKAINATNPKTYSDS